MKDADRGGPELVSLERQILPRRGHRVMLSHDLTALCGVETKVLMQVVKRNRERFPEDFMFDWDDQDAAILKSRFVTSSWGGARRAQPCAFTPVGKGRYGRG